MVRDQTVDEHGNRDYGMTWDDELQTYVPRSGEDARRIREADQTGEYFVADKDDNEAA